MKVETMDAPKPEIAVAVANGVTRLVGVGKAAAWLGVAASTVRNVAAGRGPVRGYTEETIGRIEREYPQIKGALTFRRMGTGRSRRAADSDGCSGSSRTR
jgi:hypothetical protein